MSIPDFRRAEYVEPQVIEGDHIGVPVHQPLNSSFAQALLLGTAAALAGAIAYALVGLSGFMVSIVAIGIGWLIAKAMMTASGGVGGRPYQIAAVVLTYFAVTLGELLGPLWKAHAAGMPIPRMINPLTIQYFFFGPFMELHAGLNGLLGILILVIGMRAAWRVAAGGTVAMSPFGGR